MSQVITNAFENYWQSCLTAEQPVVLDEFILADIPNLDITSPIDPETGLPPESQIVHRQNVDQRGRINNNAVAYTIVMDTTVGDFSFNAMYLRNKQNGVIGMIVYKGRETKLKTDQTTGQTGNSLVKSMLMGYDQAASATLTHVDAGTWQIDYAARLRGMDEDIRQLQADLYGHHTFVGDGFKVVEKDGVYQVSQGVAIIGGLRVELKAPEVIHPGTKPIGVWVDAYRAGSLLSEHQNHFTIITSVADLADHVDSNGYQHYAAKLATVLTDGTIEDGRGSAGGGSGGAGSIPDTFALWKRSMAEAGYDLIGQFGTEMTIETADQVVLSKDGRKVYAWMGALPKYVSATAMPESTEGIADGVWVPVESESLRGELEGEGGAKRVGYNPTALGSITVSQHDLNTTHVNAVAFNSLQAAVDHASSTGKKLVVDGNFTVENLKLTGWHPDKHWHVDFNGQITVKKRLDFIGMHSCHIKGGVFICPEIYIQGLRFSSLRNIELRGKIYLGKWDGEPNGASWSLYWNKFSDVKFGAIFVKTTISSCSINCNTFSNCVFRDNQSAGQLWHLDVAEGKDDPAMTGNTFTGCDWSYSPAWNFAYNYGYAFSATVIGGYLDTNTPWYKSGSFLHMGFDVIGLRNPSGASLDAMPSSNLKMTSGGARPQKSLPVGSVSLVKNPPKRVSGTNTFYLASIPYDGDYTLNVILNEQEGITDYGVGTVRNDTSGSQQSFNTAPGQTSVTFHAKAGDVVRVTWGVGSGQPTLLVSEFSVTSGAGVHRAVKLAVAEPYEYDSGDLVVTTTPKVALTIMPNQYTFTSRDILVTTLDPDGGLAGGGERVKLSLVTSSGGSSTAATIQEYARVLVNGPGGTSDDPSPIVVTTSISGRGVNILLSVTSGTVNARVKATYDDAYL